MHFLSLPFETFETDRSPAQAAEESMEPVVPCMHFRRQGRIIATACFYPNRTELGSNWFDGERFRLLFHRKHLPDIRKQIEQGNVLSVADLLQIQARFRMSMLQPQSRRLYWGPAAGRHAIP